MDLKLFLLIAFILFTLGIGGIFLTNQMLQIRPVNPMQSSLLRKQTLAIPGWSAYTDTIHSFTIQHPTSSPAVTSGSRQATLNDISPVVHFSTASDITIGDLTIARSDDPIIGVTVSTTPDTSRCFSFPTSSSTAIILNTIPFKTASWSDAAMGGERGLISEYHTVRDKTCYIVQSIVHYRDIAFLAGVTGNRPHAASAADLKQQADWIEQQQKIQSQIVRTFSFSQ